MPSNYNNPDLMVIGDSLAQGCKSLTIKAEYLANAYGAIVAKLAGINFDVADPKRVILLDLEKIADYLGYEAVVDLLGRIDLNYTSWQAGFGQGATNSLSGAKHFDNVAVSGFTVADVAGSPSSVGTPALAQARLAATPTIDLLGTDSANTIGDLHVAINSRFVLNPGNDPELMTMSQIDWVVARAPKNLIVHMGHNDGLYAIGSQGSMADWNFGWVNGGAPALTAYLGILDRLATAPSLKNTNIVVLGLPKISAVANMMPPLNPTPSTLRSGYFSRYQSVFPGSVTVSDQFMIAADQSIAAANAVISAKINSLAAGGTHISYFSVYDFFAKYDSKNLGSAAETLSVGGYELTNTYLSGKTVQGAGDSFAHNPDFTQFASGGFQSIDGMHPTAIGYALLATEIVQLITGTPVSDAIRSATLLAALNAETLITNFPQCLDGVGGLLFFMHRFGPAANPVGAGNTTQMAEAVSSINDYFS